MLIGYVSDERYVALARAKLVFVRDGMQVAEDESRPRGGVYADVAPGAYAVTVSKPGYGAKRVDIEITADMPPYHFRLLSDTLYGYMWPKWVRSGERSEFRVHSAAAYKLSLWRYGYEREFVRLLGWYDEHGPRSTVQITPDGDYTQTGVQWNKVGYGSPNLTQMIEGPERSGLYYLHATNEAGEFFSFPWVVAPAQPRAPIAVLASTNTWNAYNNFGGRSNYINANQLPPQPTVNGRQDLIRYTKIGSFNVWGFEDDEYAPLSFERPELGNFVRADEEVTDPIWGRLQCGMAPAEWRFLGWLEREGYDYDYYAEAQLHDGTLDLDAYKVLILSVHPEYWSAQMVQRVRPWVYDRGGKLMYLGGNGLNCEVEFLDADTLRFKSYLKPTTGGELGMVDPNDPSRYLESRMHRSTGESEASLLGVVTTDSGIMTAAPYRVRQADHSIFTGTGLRDGDRFGAAGMQERISGGASGHETDKMSASSPPGTVLLAKGINPDEGGAELVYYETDSGGAVYSAGSITYNASILVDSHISRLTANVITRFLSD